MYVSLSLLHGVNNVILSPLPRDDIYSLIWHPQLFIPSVSSFCVTDEIPFFIQLVAPAGYLHLKDGEEPTLQVSLRRRIGISIQEASIWRDMTSSQGVVKPLSSGTLYRPSLDAPEPGPSALSLKLKPSSESILTRGFKRNRTIKGTREERIDNGKMKTWEWKGTVCNNGIKVGGCNTDVLVLNVSASLCCSKPFCP